jgi:hypothetical protein
MARERGVNGGVRDLHWVGEEKRAHTCGGVHAWVGGARMTGGGGGTHSIMRPWACHFNIKDI